VCETQDGPPERFTHALDLSTGLFSHVFLRIINREVKKHPAADKPATLETMVRPDIIPNTLIKSPKKAKDDEREISLITHSDA
jgi:hypothetical protein